jgi:GMP synthase (glutamine-hydrolysing)
VYRSPVGEIGWHRIELTDAGRGDPLFGDFPQAFAALEWHNDVFALPPGAVALAASARYPVQAFRIGRLAYGTLFHLEVTESMVEGWTQAFDGGRPLPAGDAAPDYEAANTRAVILAERLFCGR